MFRSRQAFTIIELLIVVGVLALLMGLLLPVLGAVRANARQTVEMSSARQLMLAYTAYTFDHSDSVMPGRMSGLPAYTPEGIPLSQVSSVADLAARYTWRIAPYLSYDLRVIYVNEQRKLLEQFENSSSGSYSDGTLMYLLSLFPSLGLNTRWMGGDEGDNAFEPSMLQIFGRWYVAKLTEVRHTDRLMVFASARGAENPSLAGSPIHEGYFRIQSPRFSSLDDDQWSEFFDASEPPGHFGFVSPRHLGEAVTAFTDLHIDTLTQTQLHDMRFWANRAETEDYGISPIGSPP